MCTEDPIESITELSEDSTFEDTSPESSADDMLHRTESRRTVLKVAALGAAAAALFGKSDGLLPRIGTYTARADDLSTFQCTANDVRIIGSGQVLNEPCECEGTFSAEVLFSVENNAASDRGCITLHLVPVMVNGTLIDLGDVILNNGDPIPGKTTQTVTAIIHNYPCGGGLVCFGSASGDGRRRCDPGECATVSWAVPGQDSCPVEKQISSKCRHQQICIQGRGDTTLDCDISQSGIQTNCSVPCGETKTLRLCTTNSASLGPFMFTLNGQSFGPSPNTCHDFVVGPISESTQFTGTVTDNDGCAKSETITLTVDPISVEISGPDTSAGCTATGAVSFTATAGGTGPFTYYFSVDGVEQAGQSSNVFVYTPASLADLGICHSIGVRVVSDSGCEAVAPANATFQQCINTTAC